MRRAALATGLLCLALAACAGWDDYDPPMARELPDGPGALSGEDGEFAIERDLPGEDDDREPEEEASER